MREENEQRKLQKVDLDREPRLIEGLETNFKTFETQEDEKPSLIQKVILYKSTFEHCNLGYAIYSPVFGAGRGSFRG